MSGWFHRKKLKRAYKKTQKMKFRHQLSLIFVVGILIMAFVTSIAVSNISSQIVREREIQQGLQITSSLAKQSELALLYQSEESAAALVDQILNFPGVKTVIVATDAGVLLKAGGDVVEEPQVYFPQSGQMVHEDESYWVFSAPVIAGTPESHIWTETDEQKSREILGYITIKMGKDTVILMEKSILNWNLTISITVAVVLLLLLLAVSRRLTNPIERLSAVMKQAEDGDSTIRAEVGGPVDITEMQHAFNSMMRVLETKQRELMHAMSTALESARVKGEFAANVTHELRTPMNAVLGMLELLMNMGLTPKQIEYVETAKSSGENLLELIGDVLNFSENNSVGISIVKEDCYIRELLDDVTDLLANQALKKKLDFGYLLDNDVPRVIQSDPSRLRQVLINLVGNAIKFTDLGEVSIHVYVVTPEFKLEAPMTAEEVLIRFEVKDCGIGISESDQQRIFEAFTQADSSSTKQYEGTGLGLAITQQIVDLMNGDITVSSELGVGSSFCVTIATPKENHEESDSIISVLTGMNAVLVDDSDIVRRFGEQQLVNLGATCTVFEKGIEAVEYLRSCSISGQAVNILIVDEDMPGLAGVDLLNITKEETALKDTLILLLCNPWVPDGLRAISSEIRLNKPLKIKELRAVLGKPALRGEGSKPTVPSSTIQQIYSSPRRILVVDDNRPNQKVAVGMLERMGCFCEVAETGKEAIEAIIRQRFDAILMDCYMPVINGYEATRQIRMYEGADDSTIDAVPIIAMTANNSQAEVDRCLEAGMNDFLSKPLRVDALTSALIKWVPKNLPLQIGSEQQKSTALTTDIFGIDVAGPNYDLGIVQDLKSSIGEIVISMMEAFNEDTPVYLASLKTAVAEGCARQVRELAHTIKGSASNFGAQQVVGFSRLLEDKGLHEDLSDAVALYEELHQAFIRLRKSLEEYIINQSSSSETAVINRSSPEYRLLIVEDDRSMRLALKNFFRTEDYKIEEAGNGMQAISMCQRNMPDLVLMDAMMPEVDGFTACERIRSLPGGAETPILMITASEDEDSVIKAFSAGATDFIPKPIHFAVLKQRVYRLIQANIVEQHVKKLAYHDSLTGLPNRASLMQQMRVMVNRAKIEDKKIAILFLDLDRFKLINDTLGHDAGDLLLKAVSDRIRRCVRNQDFIARLGGDEFTIILEGLIDKDIVSKIAVKICDAIGQPFAFLQQRMFVTASIGISMYPDDGDDISALMKHADSAMFKAKENRNDYCFYEQGMEDEIAHRMELERELRHAVREGQLILFYQPQIDLISGKVIAAEALVRWQHPEHGLVPPDTFIPLAEESGLINEISDWVLEDACRQLKLWNDSGYQLKVAVNMSSKDLQSEGFSEKLFNVIERYNIDPKTLELEITEGTLMKNPEIIEDELNAMRRLGVTLAIDDFGSGFSSLNYLKRLPVDILKIDRMFIRDLGKDDNDLAIVAGIVALAKNLGLSTVAEGVETAEQFQLLQDLGCDTCQGYYFSKPIPALEFEKQYLAK